MLHVYNMCSCTLVIFLSSNVAAHDQLIFFSLLSLMLFLDLILTNEHFKRLLVIAEAALIVFHYTFYCRVSFVPFVFLSAYVINLL